MASEQQCFVGCFFFDRKNKLFILFSFLLFSELKASSPETTETKTEPITTETTSDTEAMSMSTGYIEESTTYYEGKYNFCDYIKNPLN